MSCNNGKLTKVERFKNEERIVCSYTFGTLVRVEKFINNKEGYIHEVNDEGYIKTYQVYTKPLTKEVVRRELLSTTVFANIEEDGGDYKDYQWDKIYIEDPNQCKCKQKQ